MISTCFFDWMLSQCFHWMVRSDLFMILDCSRWWGNWSLTLSNYTRWPMPAQSISIHVIFFFSFPLHPPWISFHITYIAFHLFLLSVTQHHSANSPLHYCSYSFALWLCNLLIFIFLLNFFLSPFWSFKKETTTKKKNRAMRASLHSSTVNREAKKPFSVPSSGFICSGKL